MKTKEQIARHERDCRICAHVQREAIELELVEWEPPARVARRYKLSRASLYRHARAIGLFLKRERNIRAALAKIIEQAGHVPVTGATVVAAVAAFAKINAAGQWIDRSEAVSLNDLFGKMTRVELSNSTLYRASCRIGSNEP